jgi:hypothetical protein
MAPLKPRFARPFRPKDKSQPRFLSRMEGAQPCSWTDCSVQATSALKGNAYCPSHLFKILQQQWQE